MRSDDPSGGVRLGVYIDTVVRIAPKDGQACLFTGPETFAFLRYVGAVGQHFGSVVIAAREGPESVTPYAVPALSEGVGLPYYKKLSVKAVAGSFVPTVVRLWRFAGQVDVIWAFGPHPFGIILLGFAFLRQRQIRLGVRQDTLKYFRARVGHTGSSRITLHALTILDLLYRFLARWVPVTVVGRTVLESYGGPRPNLFPMVVSTVSVSQVVANVPGKDWTGVIRLLSVGRLEPEKDPFSLLMAMAALNRLRPRMFTATWVGDGAMAKDFRAHAQALGIGPYVHTPGFVPVGDALLRRYRESHIFVHTAVTEAYGQVLLEAAASGLPIVATDVGGVRDALGNGQAGMLVPPGDSAAIVDAVLAIISSESTRRRITTAGLRVAQLNTMEHAARDTAAFLQRSSRHDRRAG